MIITAVLVAVAVIAALIAGMRLLGAACRPNYWPGGTFTEDGASHDPSGGGHG